MSTPPDHIVNDPQETIIANDRNATHDSPLPDALLNLTASNQNPDLNGLSSSQALALFQQNPVGFIQQIVGDAAHYHLGMLKEQAELDGAIRAFQKTHPDFQRFQQFIMQEAADLLQSGDSVATQSWPQVLEKAMENFKQKFTQAIQENQSMDAKPVQDPPYVEGGANRSAIQVPASFTRAQIGKMSMQDFLKNEAAINDALKNNRIQ